MSESNLDLFDAIIIGVGQSGGPLALALAEKDYKVALIEKNEVGGSCINYGCTPSKTMMESAKVANIVRVADKYGIDVVLNKVKLEEVVKRKDTIVNQFRESLEKSYKDEEFVELIFGEAEFVENNLVRVNLKDQSKRLLKAEKIFINTGARPDIPEIEGLKNVDFLNSTTIMELTQIPEHLLVLGGSYIGLEFGQMFRRFGSKVTIIEHGDQLVGREDKDIADELRNILEEEGIEVILNASVKNVNEEQGILKLELNHESKTQFYSGSHILVATGIKPNTEALKLDVVGIETDEEGYIQVNDYLETSVQNIYAMGDVKGGPAFTHISYDDFRVLKANIFREEPKSIKDRMVPYTMFTCPELGRVGLNEKEAVEKEINIKIAKMPMRKVARAIEKGETKGLMKVIIDQQSDNILGAAILGVDGGELLAVLQVAMMGNLPYTYIRDGIFSHPTLAESFNNLFMNVEEVD